MKFILHTNKSRLGKVRILIFLTLLFCLSSCGSARYAQLQKQGMTIHADFKSLCLDVPFNNFWFAISGPMMDCMRHNAKLPEGVKHKVISIELPSFGGAGGCLTADVYWRADEDSLQKRTCLFYLHGGGGGYKAAPYHAKLASQYALQAHCVVIMPDYHRMPKAVFPLPQQEMLATYQWVLAHADELGIDTTRIATGGDSAGGFLSAMLCTMIAEHNQTFKLSNPQTFKPIQLPVCQMLIYPGLDSERSSVSAQTFTETPIWNAKKNARLWRDYNSNNYPKEVASMLFRPVPSNMPPTYVETAEWDCLRDEGLLYAERLQQAGIQTTVNPTQGTIHGYDIKIQSQVVQQSLATRIQFLISYLR